MPDVQATVVIAADPNLLYDLVTDITQMGRWSPENTGGRWLGDATGPVVGACFQGNNRSGWRRWSTNCTVTEADPGRRFGFAVTLGPFPISQWTYEFQPSDGGCRVTESWADRRPAWMRVAAPVVMGVANRSQHNRAGMEATLAALKQAAEQQAGAHSA